MRIREIIEQQGITTKELADRMGITQSALNQHISGNPSVKVLSSIAANLGVEIWQLFVSPSDVAGGGRIFKCPNCGQEFEVELKVKSE